MAFSDTGYVLVQGRVFIAERVLNGADVTGLDFVGDADSVTLSVSQKTDTIKGGFSTDGHTTANPVLSTDCKIKINALDGRLKTWAAATWGANSGAVASGTVSAEPIKLYNGQWAKLGKIGVSNVVIPGATLGADYVLDSARHGMVRVLSTSTAIPAGTPLTTTVNYDYAANNGRVEAMVLGQKAYRVIVAGVNVAQGNQPMVLEVRQVQLEVSSKIDALSNKHAQLELSGDLIYDDSLPPALVAGDLSNLFSLEKA